MKEKGFTVNETEVICIKVANQPGELANVLDIISSKGINIEYMYEILKSHVVFKVDQMDRALKLLEKKQIKIVSQEEIENL